MLFFRVKRIEGVEEFVGKLADDQGTDLESFNGTSSRPCVPPRSSVALRRRKRSPT